MKLIIKGSDNKIKRLAKELRLRAKRNKLELSLIEDKKQEASKPPVKKEQKQKKEVSKKS